jgi:hypothetical protein
VTENDIEATAASNCALVSTEEAVKTRSGKEYTSYVLVHYI